MSFFDIKSSHIAVFSILFIFLLVGAFGITFGMNMNMHGDSSLGCIFMKDSHSLCSMGILDHISAWRSAFSATLLKNILVFAYIFAFTLIVLFLTGYLRLFALKLVLSKSKIIPKISKHTASELSDGILNTKIY